MNKIKRTKKEKAPKSVKVYTFGEEIGNAVSHGVPALALIFGSPFVSIVAFQRGGWLDATCVCIFLASLILMFLSSTLYHCMAQESKHKAVFRILDHIFIYVAIAGTYTPIALSVIGGWQGWVIFGIQWAMVLAGILYKSLAHMSLPKMSVAIYLIMGWTVVMFFPIFLKNANLALVLLIALGGIFYSGGVIFYTAKYKYSHMIWHLLIILGALSHFFAITFFL